MSRPMQVRVDRVACTGHGACAELLPELIQLDEWGFPIIDEAAVPPHLVKMARRGVATCPELALRLEAVPR